MITLHNTLLMVTDIQGRLASLMYDRDSLYRHAGMLIDGISVLDIPILWIEQYPEGLGSTVPDIAEHLKGLTPLPKRTFSSVHEPHIYSQLLDSRRTHIILSGIETHVCIYQTARDLIKRGYTVYAPEDAVSSRTEENKRIGLNRIAHEGGILTSVEMLFFELLETSENSAMKKILSIIK